jgi:hypothetical protein
MDAFDKWLHHIRLESYSSSQEAELRLVLDKDLEDLRVVANPFVSKYTTGDEDKKIYPGPDAAIYYREYLPYSRV